MIRKKMCIFIVSISIILYWTVSAMAGPLNKKDVIPDCEKLTFSQTGQNHQIFSKEEVGKSCHNIQTALETVISLTIKGCQFRLEAFSNQNCDDESHLMSYPLNARHPVVKLNELKSRKPICSFFVPYMPREFMTFRVTFKFLTAEHTYYVYQAKCYNLCSQRSKGYYPHLLELTLGNGDVARDYDIILFSSGGCQVDNKITYDNGSTAMVKNGANLVALTQQTPEVFSYKIFRA